MKKKLETVTLYFVPNDAYGQRGTRIEKREAEKNTAAALVSWWHDPEGAWFRTEAEAAAYTQD